MIPYVYYIIVYMYSINFLAKLKERPTHKMLSQITDYLASNWRRIGFQLLEPEHVQNIESTTKPNVDKCLDMLIKWLETDKNPTYSRLIDALYLLEYQGIAEKIKKKLLK